MTPKAAANVAVGMILSVMVVADTAFGQTEAERRPNVLLVMTDDQGYGDIHAHGNEMIRTPNLDSLARGGLRFTDFYNTARCWPTRGARCYRNP